MENCFDYVFFHNNDGFLAANALEPLVESMESDKSIGLAQSLMILHPETDLINSAGNSFHYLGFGFCDNYRTKISDFKKMQTHDISYASGAALLVSTNLIRQYGAWDETFFCITRIWNGRYACVRAVIELWLFPSQFFIINTSLAAVFKNFTGWRETAMGL
jgi:GT2 family glycosyltransferase